jgi:hypothetical protein
MAKKGQSLLITREYDQEQGDGPPLSVTETEIRAHLTPDFMVERQGKLILIELAVSVAVQ